MQSTGVSLKAWNVPPVQTDTVLLSGGDLPGALKTNNFAFDFLQAAQAEEDEEENLLLSPLSAAFPLAMLSNGAKGETFDELSKLLGYEGAGTEEINAHFEALKKLSSSNQDVTIEQTNVAWVNPTPGRPNTRITVYLRCSTN